MIDDFSTDYLINLLSFLEIKYIVIFSLLNRKYNNLINNKFIFFFKNIVKNYKIDFFEQETHITLKYENKALTLPNSIIKIKFCENISSFLKS